MKEVLSSWKAYDDLEIFSRQWQALEPKGVIALVHGMGEHSGRYAQWAQRFTEKDWSVFAFDHIGHGKSGGQRGHVRNYNDLLDQVDRLLEEAVANNKDVPIVLYGHSMGGNVVANYALRRKSAARAFVVTSPWLHLAFEPPAIKVALGKLMRKIYPAFTENSNLDARSISRLPEVTEAYNNDPLVHRKVSTSFFFGCKEAGEWALENGHLLDRPMLLTHGDKDEITSFEASQNWAQKNDKRIDFKAWQDCYHELHNEPEQQEVFDFILEWMESKLSV